MAKKKKNYFVRANSSQGLMNLISSNITGLKTCFVLNGSFEIVKQEVLSAIAEFLLDSQYQAECIHSIYEPDALEGLIIREKYIGIFNSTLLSSNDLKYFTKVISIDLDSVIDEGYDYLKEDFLKCKNICEKFYKLAYSEFAHAILIHDDWEKIYIHHMHFERADKYTEEIIAELFQNVTKKEGGETRHRFFGGATYKGSVDFVNSLTESFGKRYFIKGRPGSGKSTLLRKIQETAENLGYDVEVYHCGFDPKSLDMIILDDLDLCIFDSTAPHEYFPSLPTDSVIDMYATCIDSGTDEKYRKELDEIVSKYKAKIEAGVSYMKQGNDTLKEINRLIGKYIRKDVLNKIKRNIEQYIDF